MTFDDAKRYLIDRARERGVDAEVLATEIRELTLEAFEGDLSQMTQANQGGVGLRVVTGGRVGYASTEERSTEALDWILDEAIENAELQSDTDGFLPAGHPLGNRDLLDEGLSAPVEVKAERALALEAGLRSDERTKQIFIARYTEREITGSLLSTEGADGGYRNGFAGVIASFVMEDGDSLKQGFDLDFEKEFHSLDPGRTALRMVQSTGRLLGARPLATGRYRAYLEPKVVASLLGVLLYPLSGKTLVEGKSHFAGKLGRQIASEHVTLVDDATLEIGMASRPFDSEGTPSQRVVLIDGGVLTSFMHNSYTARRSGHANTAHAARSYRSTLGVGATNLLLEPGAGVNLERGVLVTDLMGLHAGANPISGDISLQAFGLLVEGGEIGDPVENFVISGNLFEMLEAVTAVGNEVEWTFTGTAVGAPMLELDSLSFAGA